MESFLEELAGYILGILIASVSLFFYLRGKRKKSRSNIEKIEKAKEMGIYEPVSLHPVVNESICIGSAACVMACPEKDIIAIVHGKASAVNTSRCVGHGACFHACPVQAISLYIGTEKRGVELPHMSEEFETNVPGLYIAGELGGMGLIKNAVEQGKQAVEYFMKKYPGKNKAQYDLLIIGAGPAGIAASLKAKEKGLSFITLEQDTLGGTVYSFPRQKLVMTNPMDLPLHGKVKLYETSKDELITLWKEVLEKNQITVNELEKVESVERKPDHFEIKSSKGTYTSRGIIMAIGRRGTPRKIGCAGEVSPKVYYRLLEPELIKNQKILVVGGGDSAIENAMMLADEGNEVHLSYRSEAFSRLKPKNSEKINQYIAARKIIPLFSTTVTEITEKKVRLKGTDNPELITEIENDLVYVYIGGELPTQFLEKAGIHITKRFGEPILFHKEK